MLNYYLTEPNKKQDSCYWLDIDPGQPEFGPSGQISLIKVSQPLLGPSFSNQASRSSQTCKLIKSHALAANSPGEDIEHYLACVLDLVNHLQKINGLRRDPLLINCPGWVIGSGLDILERVISNLSLSTIILLDNTGDTIEAGRHIWNAASSRNVEVCEVVSQHSRPPYRPAAEFRAMQSMSYFHSSQNREGFWHGVPLANLQPISLPYASEQRYNVTTVMSYYSIMQTTQIPAILEGQMVALVVITSPNAFAAPNSKFFDEASNATSFTTDAKTGLSTLTSVNADKAQITVTTPLTPKFSHCLGQAIVQKVDTNTKTFHLSTPVTMNDIRTALQSSGFETEEEEYPYLVLVRGRFDSPDWSFLERLYNEERCTNKISNTRSRSVDWDLSEEEEEDCQIYENDDQSNDQIIINESSRLVSHPYVTIRDVPTSAMTNADSGSTRSISTIKKPGEGGVTAAVLSGKVWRPRYLPRNGRQGQ